MFQTHSIGRPWHIEPWVQRIARTSGQPVDWHFAGGRVMVLALGDLAKVRNAIRTHMPLHDALHAQDMAQYEWAKGDKLHPCRPAWWDDDANPERDTVPRVVKLEDGTLALHDLQAVAIVEAVRQMNRNGG